MATTYTTKKAAVDAANTLRKQGHMVRIFRHEGIYTQPGKGIAATRTYYLQVR